MNLSRSSWSSLALFAVLATAGGCKEDDLDASGGEGDGQGGSVCDPSAPEGDLDAGACAEGLRCEPVAGSTDSSVCGRPISLEGMVVDASTGAGIEGALVLAVGAAGAPLTGVATTDASGNYSLDVPVPRDTDGTPSSGSTFTLQATANDYQPYPGGLRPSIPVDTAELDNGESGDGTAGAEESDEPVVIENPTTTVALVPLLGESAEGVSLSGTVLADEPSGTLVVAQVGAETRYAVADTGGDYTMFNVPTGTAQLQGYRAGLVLTPTSAEVEDADLTGVDLNSEGMATSVVSGSVNIVNAPGGAGTSVVLVPTTVFNDALERGPVPLGLRAPQGGLLPDVTSGFEIPEVPPGTYKVLAAFENDDLVRDPDETIAGTAIVEITVDGTSDVSLPESFKVTEALAVTSPGADGVEPVSGTPVFVFADDSSEDRYDVVLFDVFGIEVWRDEQVPGVSGSPTVEVSYAGPPLEEGMYYQFRATSYRDRQQGPAAISRTEDLKGLFVYAP